MKTVNTNNTRQRSRLYALAASLALTSGLHAKPVTLPSTWGEYDYKQYLYGGSGNLALSDQSATGFTALVSVNDVDAVNATNFTKTPDGTVEPAGRPAVYQEFTPLNLSVIGQKITATFNLKFNNALVAADQPFRFGFGNPANNSAFYIKMDSGEGGGDILGFRSDGAMTGTNGQTLKSPTFDPNGNLADAVPLNYPTVGPNGGFVSGFYSDFFNSGGWTGNAYPPNIGGGIYPNGVGLGVEGTLDVVHTITLSMERVAGGLKIVASWGNSSGPGVVTSTYSTPYIDADPPTGHGSLGQIGCLGFYMTNNDLFGLGAAGGSYTVSNFSLDYHVPPVVTTTYSNSGFTVNTSQDLALNVSPTVSGPTYSTNLASLSDGQAPTQIPGYDGLNHLGNGAILTYDLGAEATINEIQSYSTWPNNGRVNQDYTVDFSQDGFNWTNGVIIVVNQGTAASGDWPGVKVSVANGDSSPLATNARYVRFNFPSLQNGAVGFTEFVVNGVSFALPEAPVFTETPQDQTVTSGETVTFTAQATGFPVPVITWHFIDGSSVDHLLSTVGNTLTFSPSVGDAGRYYAVASNSAGTVNSTPNAVLTVIPAIVTNGNFAANAASFTEGASYFGGGNPSSATGWTGGSGINGTLTPAPDYFGPANAGGHTYLFMQGVKTVTQTITTVVATRYLFSFKAACRQGNVVGLTVWADNTKAPNLTIPDGGLSGTSFQDYSFVFTGSGTQTIQFVNSGTGDFTADVTDVSVTEDIGSPEAPVFTEIPQSQTVTGGDSVTFTAQATGYPTPIITWHFIDTGSVDHTLSTVGNTLTFTAKSADAGQYFAVASNSVANVNSTPAAVLTVNPGLLDETDLSLSGGSFAPLAGNNLILGNAGSSALSITSDGDGVGSPSLLTDGDLRAPQTGGPLGITGGSITYDLGSGANGVGYDITGIRSLSAWADGGRFKPKYAVSYSADGSNFTPLWTVNYSTATGNGADVSLAINSLHNVRYVKFDFSGGQQNGWVSYTELAVFGTSTAAADPFAGWINGLDWSAFTNPDKTATGDPDGDGMNNQQEFAFGLDPRFGSSVNPITQQLDHATGTFSYTRRATPATTGLTYTVLTSTDLVTWTPDAGTAESIATSGDVQTVTFTVTNPAVNGRLFVRVTAQ